MRAAALLILVVACGGDDHAAAPDAAPPGPDAEVPDAEPVDPTTITVTDVFDLPLAGIPVVFSDPAGETLEQVMTDAAGTASGRVPPGGAVTVLLAEVVTFAGVQPGDAYAWKTAALAPLPLGTAIVNHYDLVTDAWRYVARTGSGAAGSGGPSWAVPFTLEGLGSDGKFDVLGLAYDTAGALLAWSFQGEVTPTVGDTYVTALPVWQTPLSMPVTLSNAPVDAASIGGELNVLSDGVAMARFVDTGADLDFAIPGGGDEVRYAIDVDRGTGGQARIVARTTATSAAHDLAATLLPTVGDFAVDVVDGRVELTWTAGGELSITDGAIVEVEWADGTRRWRAVVPPSATSPYRLPAVPAAQTPLDDAVFAGSSIRFVDADSVATYGQLRSGLGAALMREDALDLVPAGGVIREAIGSLTGSCLEPRPCPPTSLDDLTVCGRIHDVETEDSPGAVAPFFYDGPDLYNNPTSAQPLWYVDLTVDSCGWFVAEGVFYPVSNQLAMVIDDAAGAPDDHRKAFAYYAVTEGQQLADQHAYAIRRATDEAWSAAAGLTGSTLVDQGLLMTRFLDDGAPIAGVTLTLGGSEDAGLDFYFSDAGATRHTLTAAGPTSANGSVILSPPGFVTMNGTNGGCAFGNRVGGPLPGFVWYGEHACP